MGQSEGVELDEAMKQERCRFSKVGQKRGTLVDFA